MKEYLLLFRGGKPMSDKTEAESKAEMQAWDTYMGGLTQSGVLVGGVPLVGGGRTITPSGTTAEPVTSAKEGIVGGYIIVKAENFDDAEVIAKRSPHIAYNGNIEIREVAPMPTPAV